MRRLAAALCLLAGPALAQQTVEIDQAACRALTRHVPAPDVEYVPGRDVVNGKPVAPADLSPGIQIPTRFSVVVAIDVAKKLRSLQPRPGTRSATDQNPNLYALPRGGEAKAYLGVVTVEGDRLYFDGQPLTDDLEAEFAALCRGRQAGR
jgi:hypothetical protein